MLSGLLGAGGVLTATVLTLAARQSTLFYGSSMTMMERCVFLVVVLGAAAVVAGGSGIRGANPKVTMNFCAQNQKVSHNTPKQKIHTTLIHKLPKLLQFLCETLIYQLQH